MKQRERYLIKCTYLEGPHKGHVYFLRKEGYVTDLNQYQGYEDTYASKAIAQRICDRKKASNDQDYIIERKQNQWDINRGRPGKEDWQFMYWPESYEPVHVDPETAKVDLQDLTRKELNYLLKDN